jgi:hypothetical protein
MAIGKASIKSTIPTYIKLGRVTVSKISAAIESNTIKQLAEFPQSPSLLPAAVGDVASQSHRGS